MGPHEINMAPSVSIFMSLLSYVSASGKSFIPPFLFLWSHISYFHTIVFVNFNHVNIMCFPTIWRVLREEDPIYFVQLQAQDKVKAQHVQIWWRFELWLFSLWLSVLLFTTGTKVHPQNRFVSHFQYNSQLMLELFNTFLKSRLC